MPKKTVETIIEHENHYVIGVKKNQPKLHQQLIALAEQKPVSRFGEIERNRGRIERRIVKVFPLPEHVSRLWRGAKQAVQIERYCKDKKGIRTEMAYFLSSFEGSALFYNYGIRLHWSIENSLHWVKDTVLKEDYSKIRSGHAPSNISTIRNWALNIFRKHRMEEITKNIRLIANDIEKLSQLIL